MIRELKKKKEREKANNRALLFYTEIHHDISLSSRCLLSINILSYILRCSCLFILTLWLRVKNRYILEIINTGSAAKDYIFGGLKHST